MKKKNKFSGLKDTIAHKKGKIDLCCNTIEIPEPPAEYKLHQKNMDMKKTMGIGSTLESFLQEEDIHPTLSILSRTYNIAYKACKFIISKLEKDAESHEYSAYTFILNNKLIKYRTAKITPKKTGQFVTFWKRIDKGSIASYDIYDLFDFLIVSVCNQNRLGQFIFSKNILYEKGIVSKKNKDGKRAFRVYPLWDIAESQIAKRTQAWQLNYFVEIAPSPDIERIKNLFLEKSYPPTLKFRRDITPSVFVKTSPDK